MPAFLLVVQLPAFRVEDLEGYSSADQVELHNFAGYLLEVQLAFHVEDLADWLEGRVEDLETFPYHDYLVDLGDILLLRLGVPLISVAHSCLEDTLHLADLQHFEVVAYPSPLEVLLLDIAVAGIHLSVAAVVVADPLRLEQD